MTLQDNFECEHRLTGCLETCSSKHKHLQEGWRIITPREQINMVCECAGRQIILSARINVQQRTDISDPLHTFCVCERVGTLYCEPKMYCLPSAFICSQFILHWSRVRVCGGVFTCVCVRGTICWNMSQGRWIRLPPHKPFCFPKWNKVRIQIGRTFFDHWANCGLWKIQSFPSVKAPKENYSTGD